MTYDIAAHQRERIHRLERHVRALEEVRRQLERLLAITLKVAAGNDCDPTALLAVIEQLDQEAQKGRSIDELAQLLRDTDPDKIRKRAQAA